MVKKVYILISLLVSLSINQDWNYSADIAELKSLEGEEIKQFEGNVVINRNNLQLKTKKAIQYVNKNTIHLYGDVTMIDDKSTITCDRLIYDMDDESCMAYGELKTPVILKQEDKIINCDILSYWDTRDSIKAIGNVRLNQINSKRRLVSDQLFISRPDSLTQIINLKESAEVYNMVQSKVSEESSLMLFEDIMKGEKMEAVIHKDSIRTLSIYGMAIADYHIIKDTLLMGINNVSGDSIMIDFKTGALNRMEVFGGALGSFIPEGNNSKVDSTINYNADYIDYIINEEKSILKRNAAVHYKETIIESGDIIVNWNTNMLDANKVEDDFPVVSKAGESPMIGESMKFDLINKKGFINKGKTSFNDGFYRGDIIQRQEPNILHMHKSIYTSCDKEKPHYYFSSRKMKMIQGDKIIARPIIVFIADFPVIGFPFAILPNKGGGRRTGWIMPSFGNSYSRGNFMQNLGYYWAPNDYLDLKFLFSLYDLQGFNLKSYFRYKKRYNFEGSINSTLKRDLIVASDETADIINILDDEFKQDWDIRWIHSQTFDPYQKLNIDLTYMTSNNFYQSDNIGLELDTRLKQKIESSINYTKSWPYQKNTLNLYISDSYDILAYEEDPNSIPTYYKIRTLPKVTFRHNATKLFNQGNSWYNNIYASMSSVLTGNQKIGFYDQNPLYQEDEVFIDCNEDGTICEGDIGWDSETMGNGIYNDGEYFYNNKTDTTDYNSGVIHNINLSMTNKIFKWISVTPSISLKESWIFKYKNYELDEENNFTDQYDYNNSFKRRLSGSLSMSLSTKLYGILPFRFGKINTLRHVMSPSMSFSYQPDLSNNKDYFQTSPSGEIKDYFYGSLVGSTPTSESQYYSFTLRNDFQVKYKNESDVYEKANFLNWTLSTSYNPMKDSLQWSDINSSIQATIPKLFDIDISMVHDLYKQEYNDNSYQNVDSFENFPRLTYISASTDLALSGNKFNYNHIKPGVDALESDTLDFDEKIDLAQSNNTYEPIISSGKIWDAGLRLRYSMQESYSDEEINWDKTFWINTDIDINLSSTWKMTYSARFDLEENNIVSHSIYLFRPLHCWEFSFKWWPSGNSRGFILNIHVKNPDLRDLKIKSTGGSFFGL